MHELSDPPPHPASSGTLTHRRVGGRYLLQDEVGRGGMATVVRAHDEVLDRTVAVKLLHAHLATDPAFLDRFRREARVAAALSHPNVVTVHDWGETDEGAFLVLQLVDGPSLREVLQARGRLSPREALAVLGPAAAGLAAAHTAGLVHRDVKPENVLLGRDGTVRVTDFGLARAAASASITFGADVLVGSPHYLSPEAVESRPLDPRADVYALGVVLFECLTGRPPFEAASPLATAVAHTTRDVPPPSSLVPGLAAALDEVVARSTARDRDRRTHDAAAFGRELAAAVVGGPAPLPPLLPAPPSPPARPADPGSPPAPGREPGRSTAVVPLEEGDTVVVQRELPAGGSPPVRARPPETDTDGAASDTTDPDDTSHPRRGRRLLVVALTITALLFASGAGGYLLWDRVLAPVTPIPGVIGLAEAEAAAMLDAAGFEVTIADERLHDLTVALGHVLDQTPTGEARTGTTVRLTLSAGPRQVEVPPVVGAALEDAVDAVHASGLETAVTETHDEEVPAGIVVASEPPAGTVLDETSTVGLTVSLGPRPIPVPDLVGHSDAEAEAITRDLGLDVEVIERRYHDTAPAGQVLAQTPGPDDEPLIRGQVIELVVSDGPAPVQVPNVRGTRLDAAIEALEELGFEVEVERRGGFGAFLQPGIVFDQDPAPGTTRPRGSMVLLYAYEG